MRKTYDCEGDGIVQFDVLLAICGNDKKSMIDICSGECPNTRRLPIEYKTYIDIVYRDIGKDQDCLVVADVLAWRIMKKFDVAIALDCIEHFEKNKGFELLELMDYYSDNKIIFTPVGNYLIEQVKTNNPDSHKSGWVAKEFENMGWATIVFPNFHPLLGIGAFFALKCKNLESEFERIINELNQKEWALQSNK